MPNEFIIVRGIDPVARLLNKVPKFRTYLDESDSDLPYMVFGSLAQYLQSLEANDPQQQQAYDVLNDMCSSSDLELQNLVQVGFLEALADNAEAVLVAKQYLRGEALRLLDAVEL